VDWGRNRVLTVGKNSGPVFSRLWTNIHEILGQCKGPLFFSRFPSIVYVVFHSEDIAPFSLEVVKKPKKCESFLVPNFLGGTTVTFPMANC